MKNQEYSMPRIEQEQTVERLQQKLMEWVKQHISPELLQSPEKIAEIVRIIAKHQKEQLEAIAAALGPEAQRGLRISTSDGDKNKGDVWLNVWPEQSLERRASIHGYGESSGTTHILQGAALEEIYIPLSAEQKIEEAAPVMKAPSFPTEGTTVTVPPHYIHALSGSAGDGPLSTLSGFFPALQKIHVFEEEQHGESLSLREVATVAVDDRVTSIDFSSLASGPKTQK